MHLRDIIYAFSIQSFDQFDQFDNSKSTKQW